MIYNCLDALNAYYKTINEWTSYEVSYKGYNTLPPSKQSIDKAIDIYNNLTIKPNVCNFIKEGGMALTWWFNKNKIQYIDLKIYNDLTYCIIHNISDNFLTKSFHKDYDIVEYLNDKLGILIFK